MIGAFLLFVYAAYTSAVLRNEFYNLLHPDFVGQKYIMSHLVLFEDKSLCLKLRGPSTNPDQAT